MPSWSTLIAQPGATIYRDSRGPFCLIPRGQHMGLWAIESVGQPRWNRLIRADGPRRTPWARLRAGTGFRSAAHAVGVVYKAWSEHEIRLVQSLRCDRQCNYRESYDGEGELVEHRLASTDINIVWPRLRLLNALGEKLLLKLWKHHSDLLVALAPFVAQYQGFRPMDGIRDVVRRGLRANKGQARRIVAAWAQRDVGTGALRLPQPWALSQECLHRDLEHLKLLAVARVNWGVPLHALPTITARIWLKSSGLCHPERKILIQALAQSTHHVVEGGTIWNTVFDAVKDFYRNTYDIHPRPPVPSLDELLRQHEERNRAGRRVREINGLSRESFCGMEPFPAVVGLEDVRTAGGYTFRPLRTVDSLEREGQRMKHCVTTYVTEAAAGRSALYHVSGPEKFEATLEVISGGPADIELANRASFIRDVSRGVVNADAETWLVPRQLYRACNQSVGTITWLEVLGAFEKLVTKDRVWRPDPVFKPGERLEGLAQIAARDVG